MNSSSYTEGYSRGRADELLDLVFRKAPQFMRCGGLVSLEKELPPCAPGVRLRVEKRFCELLRGAGGVYDSAMLKQIAAEEGIHHQTVTRFTATLRRVKVRGPYAPRHE